jgi:chromosome segregation and condensation protein ScpB
LGRPLVYGTTKRFLQTFGLRHLDELPRAEILRRNETGQPEQESHPGSSVGQDLNIPATT